jgi:hypothetical protein
VSCWNYSEILQYLAVVERNINPRKLKKKLLKLHVACEKSSEASKRDPMSLSIPFSEHENT